MGTKEQLQDMIDILTSLDIRDLNEEARDEAVYVVNDIIISLEELIDLIPRQNLNTNFKVFEGSKRHY